MKITVFFEDGSSIECERVNDSKRFWRKISRWCKRGNTRVMQVIKKIP